MKNQLGRSPVWVTGLGLGTSRLGNLYRAISSEQATETVAAAWEAGIRYFDTAPHYGLGLSERRLGQALSAYPRDEYVVSTKVGRLLVEEPGPVTGDDMANMFDVPATHRRVWDFSTDGVRRSIDASLDRMGMDRVDVVLLHDPDESPDPQSALRQGYPALDALRSEGVIGAIGVGSKDVATLARFAVQTDVDVLMVAGRYTLLEQPALEPVLGVCERRGVSVLNVGVFNSGLLAVAWPDETRPYEYATVPADILAKAQAIATVCRRHEVMLPQAAIAFAAAHPAVASVVIGAGQPDHILRAAAWHSAPPPPGELWEDLVAQGLLDG